MIDFASIMNELPQFLVLIPALIISYIPMHHSLRFSIGKILLLWSGILMLLLPFCAYTKWYWGYNYLYILYPLYLIVFVIYQLTLDTPFIKGASTFLNTIALFSCFLNLSIGFDAWLHPDNLYNQYSSEASLFFLACTFALLFAIAYPIYHLWGKLVESLLLNNVWCTVAIIPLLIIVVNCRAIPHDYGLLLQGRLFNLYIALECFLAIFLLFLDYLFYLVAISLLEHSATEARLSLLELETDRYHSLQYHMEQSRQLRHDFKYTLHALSVMASENNIDGIKDLLKLHETKLSENEIKVFCYNPALDALFVYFLNMAQAEHIKTDMRIDLPTPLSVSELDMFTVIGNICENAILSCKTIPEEERYFSFTIDSSHVGEMYIVSSNSFDGNVKRHGGRFISTRKDGHGIGLSSIKSVAKKYDGSVTMTANDTEFDIDVILKI